MIATLVDNLGTTDFLNLITIALLIFGAPRAIRGTQYKAQVEEREKIVTMKQEVIDTLEDRLKLVREDKDRAVENTIEITRKFNELQAGFEGLKARFADQSRYTAEGAVTMFQKLLEQHDHDAERRHKELMEALSQINPGRRFERGDEATSD